MAGHQLYNQNLNLLLLTCVIVVCERRLDHNQWLLTIRFMYVSSSSLPVLKLQTLLQMWWLPPKAASTTNLDSISLIKFVLPAFLFSVLTVSLFCMIAVQ